MKSNGERIIAALTESQNRIDHRTSDRNISARLSYNGNQINFQTNLFMSVLFRRLVSSYWIVLLFAIYTPLSAQVVTSPIVPSQVQSESGNPVFTLEEAIQTSLSNNPEIKKAMLGVDDGNEQVKLAWAAVMPEITSSAQYTRNIEIPVNFVPARVFDPTAPEGELIPLQFGTDNNWQGGFSVSQNIFKGEALVGISTARLYKSAQQDIYRNISQQVITQTRIAYYNVLLAKENYRVLETSLQRLEELLRENKVRLEAGIADEYDVLRIEVQLANQRPLLVQVQNQIEAARRNLNLLLGLPSNTPTHVLGNLLEYELMTTHQSGDQPEMNNQHLAFIDAMSGMFATDRLWLEEPTREVLQARGDVEVLESQIALRDKQLTAFRSRFLPTVSASYNLQWTAAQPGSPSFFENAVRFQTLGLNVSMPLFQGFQRTSDITRVKIEQHTLRTDLDQTLNRAEAEWATITEELERILGSVDARKLAVYQANEGYRIATKRLESGVGSQLEVTDAELQVREAEFNYVQLVHDYLVTKANFDLATGRVPFL